MIDRALAEQDAAAVLKKEFTNESVRAARDILFGAGVTIVDTKAFIEGFKPQTVVHTTISTVVQPDAEGKFPTPLDGALWMASLGIPQTPLRGKAPFLTEWQHSATTDVNQIKAWGAQYPGCNFGSVAHDGQHFVFEADSTDVRKRFEATGGQFTAQLVIQSRPGRGHRWYRHAAGVKNISQAYTSHGDFSLRAESQQAVSPGSIHPDTKEQYRVVIAGIPAPPTAQEIAFWESERVEKKGEGEKEVPRNERGKVAHGNIHGFMLNKAGRMRRAGMNQDEIEPALLRMVHEECEPPINDNLVVAMAKSICNYPPGQDMHLYMNIGKDDVSVTEVAPEEEIESELVLPESAMTSTVLGDYFNEMLKPNDWIMELALPALATNAGVLVPGRQPEPGQILLDSPMTSFYTAFIGPVNTGKTQIHEWSAKGLGIFHPVRGPHYVQMKFGSAEQMWRFLHKYSRMNAPTDPRAFTGAVVINPDEWKHIMSKASIPDSSLSSTLTTAFNNRVHNVTLGGAGGGRDLAIPFAFSIIGGVVENEFDSVYDNNSIGGLYDRSMFGLVPKGFSWPYREFPYHHPFFKGKSQLELNPVPVSFDGSVWEVIKAWKEKDPSLTRIVEIATRVATVFASVDGRGVVTGDDLEKLWSFVEYQKDIRSQFKPNEGENPDAIYANIALAWIKNYGKNWRTVRDLQTGTNYHRKKFGPNVCFRALQGLLKDGEIEMWVSKLVDDPDNPGRSKLNDMPPGWAGKRPKLGGALVKLPKDE